MAISSEQLKPEEARREAERPPETTEEAEKLPETPEALGELGKGVAQEVEKTSREAIASGTEQIEKAVASIGGGSEDVEAGRAAVAPVQGEMGELASAAQEQIMRETEETVEVAEKAEAPPFSEDEARKRWKELTMEQKLTYCDPAVVRREMSESLALVEGPAVEKFDEQEKFSESVERVQKNVEALLECYVKEGHISREYAQKIGNSVKEYIGLAAQAQQEGGLSVELKSIDVNDLARNIVEKMVYQNKESLKRALGDHGVRHIIDGNIAEAMKMVDEYNKANPDKPLTALDKMKIMTVHFNHDMGYTVGINRTGFESTGDHKHFSQKLFDSDSAIYGKIFAEGDLAHMSEMIQTHDEAKTDFAEKPLESIVRLSDNLGLFHDTKLPEIFYSSPENLAILQKIYIAREAGQDIGGLQKQLREQIKRQPGLDETTRSALLNAATEIHKKTPEFNLGMFAGKLEGYRMEGKQMVAQLRESDMHKQIQELFNLEQKQFVKLLDSYGIDLKKIGQRFEDLVKVDERGVKYIELPPIGEGDKPLRFEFLPEDPSAPETPRNKEVKEKFAETQREWSAVNIRNEINDFVSKLERPENRTPEKVNELFAELRSFISRKLDPEDTEKIDTMGEKLRSDVQDEAAFKKDLADFKGFLTKKEKIFLAVE